MEVGPLSVSIDDIEDINMYVICVDAMGGDREPEVVLQGIELALSKFDDIEVLVAGDANIVVPFAQKHERARALVSKSSISMDEHATDSFRKKRDSSVVMGLQAVKHGEAQAFFSAGNTGAIFTAASFILGRLKGIQRPCLASFLPGLLDHETIVLDLGANADCKPSMMLGFAHLGSAYSSYYFKKPHIKLGLLSNGGEDIKGNAMTLETHKLLRESSLNFQGNAEGTDLLLGDFDCIVMDGFTGNCCLKTLEGTAKFIAKKIKEATGSTRAALGALMLKPTLQKVADSLSGDVHGGAVLLGVKAPVFIGHGSTSPVAVMNGIRVSREALEGGMISALKEGISE